MRGAHGSTQGGAEKTLRSNVMGGMMDAAPSPQGAASTQWYSSAGNVGFGGPQQTAYNGSYGYGGQQGTLGASPGYDEDDYANEPPLLEELGINFDQIFRKTKLILHPLEGRFQSDMMDHSDMAGPIVFCCVMGLLLMLSGKLAMGSIYGLSITGALGLWSLLALMTDLTVDFWRVTSVLGYGLLPILPLSALGVVLDLRGVFGGLLAVVGVGWSTFAVTRIFAQWLRMEKAQLLIGYPVGLLYAAFVLICIF